ncbi:MFS transporter [Williamsia sterculiae]|uniref:Predicted arabinose efflux permease, MFS family n=1 Tax=Williamsia sterculiae TaxID=1344003 RepID=A0A1N7HCR5_9NOCA|nr:MFS transporter [Williamsia sterculiae]SIS22666.1 Predicted arabinose efflux permease, MFS family [Williamsia sterculiae]
MTTTERLPRVLRPFGHRQYRLLAAGLALSMFGDGIWTVGVVWQIISIGGGPVELSLITGASAVGMVASSLLGGVLADRVTQRSILISLEAVTLVTVGVVALLAITGDLAVWQLAAVAAVGGVATGIYYPTYSALLPAIVPPRDLLAANGVEGAFRPVILQAAGPAMAGAMIALASPGVALAAAAASALLSGSTYVLMRPVPLRRDLTEDSRHPLIGTAVDMVDGFRFMVRTPWLLGTLLFASILVLTTMGPLEVLVPFALKDRAGGDASSHSLVLACFGAGGAIGSVLCASFPFPRRYLTAMFAIFGISSLPMLVFAHATSVWVFAVAGFVTGAAFDGPMVWWGTMLQRRVPPEMLGRAAGLDFFVSIGFMPVSMALAAPVAATLGLTTTFVLAAVIPLPFALLAYLMAGMWRDEIAHPIGDSDTANVQSGAAIRTSSAKTHPLQRVRDSETGANDTRHPAPDGAVTPGGVPPRR